MEAAPALRAFGGVEVHTAGGPSRIRSRPRRLLLAMLLVRCGRVVSADRLARADPYRGPAFDGLDDVADLATEHRVDAELALGRHTALVGELTALVAEHPVREGFRAQLMLALYRAGRKAEALATYRAGRVLLVDELGVEPSEECQALERANLADDPALDSPAGGATNDSAAADWPGGGPPRQLPANVVALTGRREQLRWLDGLVHGPAAGRVVSVDGSAGVGKPVPGKLTQTHI